MQTEPVSKQIQEIEAIKRQKRMWSWGTTGLLLVFVISCILSLRSAVYGLVNEGPTREQFQKKLGDSVQKDALPKIQAYGEEAIRGVDYAGAVKKLNEHTPQMVQATKDQLQALNKDLTDRGNNVFNKTFRAAVEDHDKKIRAMFPDATEEQVKGLMSNLTKEAQEQVADINETLFGEHKKALDSIIADMNAIQRSEPNISGEVPTYEYALMLFDIAREDLKSLTPPDKAKPTGNKSAANPAAGKDKK